MQCIDHKHPSKVLVALKISKNKKFDVDNASIEIKLLNKLITHDSNQDYEGSNRVVAMIDSFKFRQHTIIVFEHLYMNLYKYMKVN